MNWSTEFTYVAQAIQPFAFAAATSLLAYGANWLRHHTKSQLLLNAINLADTLAGTLVSAANQTIVNDLKKNGKWTSQTAQDVKANVLAELKRLLPADAKNLLTSAMSDLDTYLSNLIEQHVSYRSALHFSTRTPEPAPAPTPDPVSTKAKKAAS